MFNPFIPASRTTTTLPPQTDEDEELLMTDSWILLALLGSAVFIVLIVSTVLCVKYRKRMPCFRGRSMSLPSIEFDVDEVLAALERDKSMGVRESFPDNRVVIEDDEEEIQIIEKGGPPVSRFIPKEPRKVPKKKKRSRLDASLEKISKKNAKEVQNEARVIDEPEFQIRRDNSEENIYQRIDRDSEKPQCNTQSEENINVLDEVEKPEDALDKIKRSNFPKVLPDFPSNMCMEFEGNSTHEKRIVPQSPPSLKKKVAPPAPPRVIGVLKPRRENSRNVVPNFLDLHSKWPTSTQAGYSEATIIPHEKNLKDKEPKLKTKNNAEKAKKRQEITKYTEQVRPRLSMETFNSNIEKQNTMSIESGIYFAEPVDVISDHNESGSTTEIDQHFESINEEKVSSEYSDEKSVEERINVGSVIPFLAPFESLKHSNKNRTGIDTEDGQNDIKSIPAKLSKARIKFCKELEKVIQRQYLNQEPDSAKRSEISSLMRKEVQKQAVRQDEIYPQMNTQKEDSQYGPHEHSEEDDKKLYSQKESDSHIRGNLKSGESDESPINHPEDETIVHNRESIAIDQRLSSGNCKISNEKDMNPNSKEVNNSRSGSRSQSIERVEHVKKRFSEGKSSMSSNSGNRLPNRNSDPETQRPGKSSEESGGRSPVEKEIKMFITNLRKVSMEDRRSISSGDSSEPTEENTFHSYAAQRIVKSIKKDGSQSPDVYKSPSPDHIKSDKTSRKGSNETGMSPRGPSKSPTHGERISGIERSSSSSGAGKSPPFLVTESDSSKRKVSLHTIGRISSGIEANDSDESNLQKSKSSEYKDRVPLEKGSKSPEEDDSGKSPIRERKKSTIDETSIGSDKSLDDEERRKTVNINFKSSSEDGGSSSAKEISKSPEDSNRFSMDGFRKLSENRRSASSEKCKSPGDEDTLRNMSIKENITMLSKSKSPGEKPSEEGRSPRRKKTTVRRSMSPEINKSTGSQSSSSNHNEQELLDDKESSSTDIHENIGRKNPSENRGSMSPGGKSEDSLDADDKEVASYFEKRKSLDYGRTSLPSTARKTPDPFESDEGVKNIEVPETSSGIKDIRPLEKPVYVSNKSMPKVGGRKKSNKRGKGKLSNVTK